MRKAEIRRATGETDISLSLVLDGSGQFSGGSGIGFLTICFMHSPFTAGRTCRSR